MVDPKSQPIPDAVLRAFDGAFSVGAMAVVNGHGIDMNQLFGDFLALREAARALDGSGVWFNEVPPLEFYKAWERLRALLPEAPR